MTTLTVGFLAGGKGSRLGGRDKGLLSRDGYLQIDVLTRALRTSVSEIIVSNSRNAHLYRLFADRIVCDYPIDAGPVAGVLALLYACTTDWLAIVPCDLKQLPAAWVAHWQVTMSNGDTGCVAIDDGYLTPLAILPRTALGLCQTYFDSGGRKLSDAYAAMELSRYHCLGAGLDIDCWVDI